MFFLLLQTQYWCNDCQEWSAVLIERRCVPSRSRRVRTIGVVDGRNSQAIFDDYTRRIVAETTPRIQSLTAWINEGILAMDITMKNMAAFIDEIYNPEKRVGRSAQRSPYDVGRPEKAPKGLTASSTGWRKRR